MKCITQPCNSVEDFDNGVSGNDPRFTSDVIDQMKGVNYPDELIKLVESQYLRYGDTIKLQTKSFYGNNNVSGYLGVYKKPSGTKRMAVPPIGDTAPGKYTEEVYKIEDPYDKEKDDFVYYGDVVALVDSQGNVWNCKNHKGSLDGYLTPQVRGKSGEVFISFCKTGKQGEPIVYGEPGVKIQIEESNRFRNSFAGNKLTNFKYSKSKVNGGYVSCHGGGHLLNFFIHPETGKPDGSYVKGTTTLSLKTKSKTCKLMNFLNNEVTASLADEIDTIDKQRKTTQQIDYSPIVIDKQSLYLDIAKLIVFYLGCLVAFVWIKLSLFEIDITFSAIFSLSNAVITSILAFSFGLFTPTSILQAVEQKHRHTIESLQSEEETSEGFVVVNDSEDDTSSGTNTPTLPLVEPVVDPLSLSWRAMGKDENGVPKNPQFRRFLEGEFGNMKIAKKRWEVTCDWRESNNIDAILNKEYVLFEAIKLGYPHFILGRCKKGYPIYVESPGVLKVKKLYDAGVCVEDMLFHNIYISEFLWQVLEPEGSNNDRLLSIIDMSGIRFKDIFGDVLSVLKSATSISQAHYPERSYKIFVINIPRWFNVIFKIIKPFMAEATLKKVRIYRHGYERELLEEVDASVLPEKYGGTNKDKPYEHFLERELWNQVYKVCLKGNKKMIDRQGNEDPTSLERMEQFVEEQAQIKAAKQ